MTETYTFGLLDLPKVVSKGDDHIFTYSIGIQKESERRLNENRALKLESDHNDHNLSMVVDFKMLNEAMDMFPEFFEKSLSSVKKMAERLNSDFLGKYLPGLKEFYKDKGNTPIDIKIKPAKHKHSSKYFRTIDNELFIFASSEIAFEEFSTENAGKLICKLIIHPSINMRLQSSHFNHNRFYVRWPVIRIREIETQDCLFNVNTDLLANMIVKNSMMNILPFK